jgi:hypothetical protein
MTRVFRDTTYRLFQQLHTWLSREDVLELDVQLLLLLNEQILLDHLLGLLDEALLQRLNLLQHLVRLGIRAESTLHSCEK